MIGWVINFSFCGQVAHTLGSYFQHQSTFPHQPGQRDRLGSLSNFFSITQFQELLFCVMETLSFSTPHEGMEDPFASKSPLTGQFSFLFWVVNPNICSQNIKIVTVFNFLHIVTLVMAQMLWYDSLTDRTILQMKRNNREKYQLLLVLNTLK